MRGGFTFFDGSVFAEGRSQRLLVGLEAQSSDEQFTLVRHLQGDKQKDKDIFNPSIKAQAFNRRH